MNETIKITWYRTKVDRKVLSALMQRHDGKALLQCLLHLGLCGCTGTAAYFSFTSLNQTNWIWLLPLFLMLTFLHGTFFQFMKLVAVHELVHKTPFRRQWLNDFFMALFSFLSWSDPVSFRVSHVKHHQVTVYHDHDGEVILPLKLDWDSINFWVWKVLPFPNPFGLWGEFKKWFKYASGNLKGEGLFSGGEEWMQRVLPEENVDLRRRHRNWARVVLLGQLALAAIFIATNQWILILLVNLPAYYCGWLLTLCGAPQHIGMMPDVPDFRYSCRTYTCSPFIGFLYWNMQYHVEHHMFPAVPFYNLPALRKVIQHDLPPATHGLWNTWREIILVLKQQRVDPSFAFKPKLPIAPDKDFEPLGFKQTVNP